MLEASSWSRNGTLNLRKKNVDGSTVAATARQQQSPTGSVVDLAFSTLQFEVWIQLALIKTSWLENTAWKCMMNAELTQGDELPQDDSKGEDIC